MPFLNAVEHVQEIQSHQKLAIFLDYDGTLTPIVSRPDLALLTDENRQTLQQLAQKYPVAIISGRDRKNVEQLVNIDGIYYAGSHGFDIKGPHLHLEMGEDFLPSLNSAEKELLSSIDHIPNILIERKKFAISIHYRQVDPTHVSEIERLVTSAHKNHPDLRLKSGKMIFELQPNIPWDKGEALLSLLNLLPHDHYPIYIGDDVTDEDAFRALIDRGIGIAVQDEPKRTAATYILKNTEQVYELFKLLL